MVCWLLQDNCNLSCMFMYPLKLARSKGDLGTRLCWLVFSFLVWVLEMLANLVFQGLQTTVTLTIFDMPNRSSSSHYNGASGACGSSTKTTVSSSAMLSRGNRYIGM